MWETLALNAAGGSGGGGGISAGSSADGEQKGGYTDFGSTFTVNTGGSGLTPATLAAIAAAVVVVVLLTRKKA